MPAPASSQPQLTEITIDRPNGVIRLAFDDGLEGHIGLAELRFGCPCAACRRTRQFNRPTWTPRDGQAFPSVRSAELVGAWGLSVTWDDGHSTGIYALSSLAEWVATGEVGHNPDSGLPG